MANNITVASPPNTEEVAQQILAGIAAQSGVVTDYNKGSQIRTLTEAIGAVAETAGISAAATALQVIAYSGMSIFDITPQAAVPAVGAVTFATAFVVNPPPAVQNVPIPAGTLVQTLGGIQFATSTGVTLSSGATGISVPIVAVAGGLNSNVAPGSITQILTGLQAALNVTNLAPTTGGLDAETVTQALSRLAAKFFSLVGGSPVSVANSVVGLSAPSSSETIQFSTVYESWADPTSLNYGGSAFFGLYIDNGAGAASAGLISAAQAKLNGVFASNTPGFRPSGVPYNVLPVVPIYANVSVSGTVAFGVASQIQSAISAAVSGYFTLPFNTPAEQPQISAVVANAAGGSLSSLAVSLYYATSGGTAVPLVSGAPYNRVLLGSLTLSVS